MKNLKKLERLKALVDMKRRQKEAELHKMQTQEAALRAQFVALDEALKERERVGVCDVARQAGADLPWQQWVDTRKVAINSERARLRPSIEAARAGLAEEFGRSQALEQVIDTRAQQLQRERNRRVLRD